jgi:cbb3-type cytochrome c oxidase subunit III
MNVRANKFLLLSTSAATSLLLLTAAYQENVQQEWRRLQREYKRALPPAAAADFNVQLRQVVVPGLDVTDRCVSCHVGMAAGSTPIDGHPVFSAHPNVVHDPSEYGCTTCHAGQGRATERDAAHGTVRHWPEPMLPAQYAYAGCGICHTHLEVPSLAALERGGALVERNDCLACHKLDGRGGTFRPGGAGGMEGPDLSRAGAMGYARDWYMQHLAKRERGEPAWQASFAALSEPDRRDIEVLLSSRVGAPQLIESKALFHSLGCRGCHQVGGVGGEDGPALTRIGQRDPGQLDFTRVPPPHTVASWLQQHFRAPALVVPGSQMPEFGLDAASIDQLTFYMMSLRRSALPEAFWPQDRLRAERFDQREFAADGATLYGTFCAACHGQNGDGMRYPGMAAFPAIANPDFLALASDQLITSTVQHGRRGRRMPPWAEAAGGLRPAEIDSVVAHLRVMAGGIQPEPDAKPARWALGDPALGQRLFANHCASCHGDAGQGGEGTALADPVFQQNATDTYLTETIRRGRRGTSMQSFAQASPVRPALSQQEIEAIVTHMRTWEATP